MMDHGAVDVGEEDGAEETGVRSAGALHRRNSSSASVLLSPFVSGGGRLSDAPRKAILSGVVAYVEARSGSDNRSSAVSYQLRLLGASVRDKLTATDITHVVFKGGRKSTRDRALRRGLHLVSVLWVESCKEKQEHVAEAVFSIVAPATTTTPSMCRFKKHRSMQPRDFDDDVAKSADRGVKQRRRRHLVDKWRVLDTPTLPFCVHETQPDSSEEGASPQLDIVIPETPPSMRQRMKDRIRRDEAADCDTPARTHDDQLQRRLFNLAPLQDDDQEESQSILDAPASTSKRPVAAVATAVAPSIASSVVSSIVPSVAPSVTSPVLSSAVPSAAAQKRLRRLLPLHPTPPLHLPVPGPSGRSRPADFPGPGPARKASRANRTAPLLAASHVTDAAVTGRRCSDTGVSYAPPPVAAADRLPDWLCRHGSCVVKTEVVKTEEGVLPAEGTMGGSPPHTTRGTTPTSGYSLLCRRRPARLLDTPLSRRRSTRHSDDGRPTGGEPASADRTDGRPTGGEPTSADRTDGRPTGGEPTSADRTDGRPTGGEPTSADMTDGRPTGGEPTSADRTDGRPTGGEPTSADRTDGRPTGGEPTSADRTDGRPTGGEPTSADRTAPVNGAEHYAASVAEAACVDAMRVDAPRRDATRVDTPRRDATQVDSPRGDAARVDTPRRDATRVDTPRRDATRVDTSRRDATRVDTPRRDATCRSPVVSLTASEGRDSRRKSARLTRLSGPPPISDAVQTPPRGTRAPLGATVTPPRAMAVGTCPRATTGTSPRVVGTGMPSKATGVPPGGSPSHMRAVIASLVADDDDNAAARNSGTGQVAPPVTGSRTLRLSTVKEEVEEEEDKEEGGKTAGESTGGKRKRLLVGGGGGVSKRRRSCRHGNGRGGGVGGGVHSSDGASSLEPPPSHRVSPASQSEGVLQKAGRVGERPKSGGVGELPKSGGVGALPKSGGVGALPRSDEVGELPRSDEVGTRPKSGGVGVLPKSGGVGELPRSDEVGTRPKSGGVGTRPKSGGVGALPKSSGVGELSRSDEVGTRPKSGGVGALPKSGGVGELPKSGGVGEWPKLGGVGELPKSGGVGERPKSGGVGARPKSGGVGARAKSGGVGALPKSGRVGSLPVSGGAGAAGSGGPSSGSAGLVQSSAVPQCRLSASRRSVDEFVLSHRATAVPSIAHWKKVEITAVTTEERSDAVKTVVMTSLHLDEQDIVRSVVKRLGGFRVVDSVNIHTTHVVCGNNRRTLNVLKAIGRGCWLLSIEWVLKSLEVARWLAEEPYEQHLFFPAAQMSRLEKVSAGAAGYSQDLFSEDGLIYVAPHTTPKQRELAQLLKLCGGTVTPNLRKANVCVGNATAKSTVKRLSEQWVLDSIVSHRRLPCGQYELDARGPPQAESSPQF